MSTTLHVPQWGMGICEGRIVKWLKQPGDTLKQGEPLVEIETAKAIQEVDSPVDGILLKIMADEGALVPVRAAIAEINDR